MSDAVRLARRIVDACSQPFSIGEHTLRLSASVGIAIQGRDGDDSRALLKNADRAMYAVKQAGGNALRVCDWTPSLIDQA